MTRRLKFNKLYQNTNISGNASSLVYSCFWVVAAA